jgi:hypothetical protein
MSVAYFIVLQQEISGFDPFVNGKHLAAESDRLDQVAAELGVPPLMQFFSVSPEELGDVLESLDVDDMPDAELAEESWFEAREGLATVRALLCYLRENIGAVGNSAGVISDLEDFERVLSEAEERQVKWHLGVDF